MPIVMRVRAHGIIETMDVTEQCILKLRKRAIGAAVRLLMLPSDRKRSDHILCDSRVRIYHHTVAAAPTFILLFRSGV